MSLCISKHHFCIVGLMWTNKQIIISQGRVLNPFLNIYLSVPGTHSKRYTISNYFVNNSKRQMENQSKYSKVVLTVQLTNRQRNQGCFLKSVVPML